MPNKKLPLNKPYGPLGEVETMKLSLRNKQKADNSAFNVEIKRQDRVDRKYQRSPEALARVLGYAKDSGLTVGQYRQTGTNDDEAIITSYLGDGDPDLTLKKYLDSKPDRHLSKYARDNHLVYNYKGF